MKIQNPQNLKRLNPHALAVLFVLSSLWNIPHAAPASPPVDEGARRSPSGTSIKSTAQLRSDWCEGLDDLKKIEVLQKPQTKADFILVDKENRKMFLWSKGQVIRTYSISLGFAPEGHKYREGDGRTPEGRYHISYKNPKSQYHLSLGISYPNKMDERRSRSMSFDPGGEIMIHGFPNENSERLLALSLHSFFDWTRGCIAVTNEEIEEIYSVVPINTPIEICPHKDRTPFISLK